MSTETSEEICPDMAACRKRIEDVAPYDYKIFNEYSQRFKRQLEFLGDDFEEYVQAYKKEFAERKALVAEAGKFDKNAGWWLRDDRKVSNGSAGLSTMCKPRRIKAEFADEEHPAYECLFALEERMRLASDPDSEDPLDPFWDEFRENVPDDLGASEGQLEDPAPE